MTQKPSSIKPENSFDLGRFIQAQESVYRQVITELQASRKKSHWMWYIFPQVDGLGRSSTARRYAIKSQAEGRAYLNHPLLGPRLRECTELVLEITGLTATEIFGTPDDLKLRSSMTLFDFISEGETIYHRVLGQYFGGRPDDATLAILATMTETGA